MRASGGPDLSPMAALVIGAIDQQGANPHFAHLTQTYFSGRFANRVTDRNRPERLWPVRYACRQQSMGNAALENGALRRTPR